LINAKIKNFRLLKDVVLDFSTSNDKPLTVIRAANETGKTTAETALIWGLYGSEALPKKGVKFPLYPSDSLSRGCKKVEISVQIEFESDQVISLGRGKQQVSTCRYRLLRTCIESPLKSGEKLVRENEYAALFEVTATGTKIIEGQSNVKSVIENSIPFALKDVYFTDGDSAMSFIESAATQGVKRKRVQAAVESLLGLNILEKTIKHVGNVAKKFGERVDNTDYAKELERLNDSIDGYQEDIEVWGDERSEVEEEIKEGNKKLYSVKYEIEGLLKLGDKKKLAVELSEFTSRKKRAEDSSNLRLLSLSSLFRNTDLAASLISKPAQIGMAILNELVKKKQLPRVNMPILEELLDKNTCFCGSNLKPDTAEGKEKRKLIQDSIANSREADALSEAATSLFYTVRSQSFDEKATGLWMSLYESDCLDFNNQLKDVRTYESKLVEINSEIDLVKDTNLESLRTSESSLESKLSSSSMRLGVLTNQIKSAKDWVVDKEVDRGRIEKKLSKSDTTTEKLQTARLCEEVFQRVFDRLRSDEIAQVSNEMNRIFLEMIGADPEANDLALITKAELTQEFDIVVYGPGSHELDPDQDLNGASRRAITLAFILALTKVSKVQAPNVIDTPLGMMSGYVKQSVLNKVIEEGSQVILFLTHDEINGIENILDKKAGCIYTLTNPAHYPKMLVNKPTIDNARIIRCECDHRRSCDICERKND